MKTLSVYAQNARLRKRVRQLRKLLEDCRELNAMLIAEIRKELNL